jgi:ubiquinone/menaquinone biosynthesis C-methylase UbiE
MSPEPDEEITMTEQPKSFYSLGGINAETYDMRTETPPGEIEFYIARARASGGPVLELACGTGRVTWPVARAGMAIVGLDLELAMLEQAQRKGDQEAPEIRASARFVRGDMTDFNLGQTFGLVVIPFRAFLMLLTIEQQRAALGCARRHLRPGGTLIIDVFDPLYDSLSEKQFIPRREIPSMRNPVTGHTVSVTVVGRVNNHLQQRITEHWRFREVADDGRVLREEVELLELRWIFRYEMRHLLALSGFAVVEEFSDYLGAPPAYGKEQIWIAQRA